MPLFTYFSCMGGVLVAFLFLSDAYIASPKDIVRQGESTFSIRIRSSYPKPELIVFDISIPTIVPEQQARLELRPLAPVVTNASGSLPEPMFLSKKAARYRITKNTIANVAHLSTLEISGLSYPPSW